MKCGVCILHIRKWFGVFFWKKPQRFRLHNLGLSWCLSSNKVLGCLILGQIDKFLSFRQLNCGLCFVAAIQDQPTVSFSNYLLAHVFSHLSSMSQWITVGILSLSTRRTSKMDYETCCPLQHQGEKACLWQRVITHGITTEWRQRCWSSGCERSVTFGRVQSLRRMVFNPSTARLWMGL